MRMSISPRLAISGFVTLMGSFPSGAWGRAGCVPIVSTGIGGGWAGTVYQSRRETPKYAINPGVSRFSPI